MTRSQRVLVIYEEPTHQTRPFLELLNDITKDAPWLAAERSQVTTPNDWTREVEKLLSQDQIERARDIYLTQISAKPEDFNLFHEACRPLALSMLAQPAQAVTAAGSSSAVVPSSSPQKTTMKKPPSPPAGLPKAAAAGSPSATSRQSMPQASPSATSAHALQHKFITTQGVALLNDFIEPRLITCLNLDFPYDFERFWLTIDIPFANAHSTLMVHILSCTHKTNVFLNCLMGHDDKHALRKKLPVEKLASLFNRLGSLAPIVRHKLLCLLMLTDRKLLQNDAAKSLIINALTAVATPLSAADSLLHWLSIYTNGQELLLFLLKAHSKLLKKMPIDHWEIPYQDTAGKWANATPFYMLTGRPDGLDFLNKHPDILNRISAETWERPLSEAAGIAANTTPFFAFIETPGGLDILRRYPDILNKISAKTWGLPLTGAHINVTPFYWLVTQPDGLAILREHPDILRKISDETWGLPLTAAGDKRTYFTPFYKLTEALDGLSILKEHPEILEKISSETWDLPGDGNRTPLHNLLFRTDDAIAILSQRPMTLEKISSETWGLSLSRMENGGVLNYTPFHLLVMSPNGRAFLSQHPEILKKISPKTWGKSLASATDEYMKTTPLFFITEDHDGRVILQQLFDNHPAILTSIPIQAWRACRPRSDGAMEATPLDLDSLLNIGAKIQEILDILSTLGIKPKPVIGLVEHSLFAPSTAPVPSGVTLEHSEIRTTDLPI